MFDIPENSNLDQSLDVKADPSKYVFLKSLNLSQDVVRRLSLHLDNIVRGSSEVYLTPIGKDHTPELILNKFDDLFNAHKYKLNETLCRLELANRSKYGPRSIALPWDERKQGLMDYFNNTSHSSIKYNIKGSNSLRPMSLSLGVDALKNNTNSGLPYYTRKSRIKDRVSTDYDRLLSEDYPCILFTRTQEGNKTRNVWGYPVADTIRESLYYFPLLEYQKRQPWRASLLGPYDVDSHVTRLIKRTVAEGKQLLSVDFSAYDASISSSLEDAAFDYIINQFQPRYRESIIELRERFKTIGIVTPDGVYTGQHGVPSGSTFTNEVDSLIQYVIAKSNGVDDDRFQIQGDDGLYSLDNHELQRLEASFKHFGLNFNEEKSYKSDNYCIFLQKLYHTDYTSADGLIGGIYPLYRALCRIIYQERYSNFEEYDLKGIDYYSIRTIAIWNPEYRAIGTQKSRQELESLPNK